MSDIKDEIARKIKDAYKRQLPLEIKAGGTKHFYGRQVQGEPLVLSEHIGITEYEPSELYITARSGTPLREIEQTIARQKQMLPCDPPYFGSTATLGGMIATGLCGPRRAHAGAVRDCILGSEIINGKGEYLRFGGKVMKNVAGYDVSRLMCGALGTLGVIMSATLRVIPKPACEHTIALTLNSRDAIHKMNKWASTPLPITATFHDGRDLYIRLSGSLSTVETCTKRIGGERVDWHDVFWVNVKEQAHECFLTDLPLWRISVPPNAEPLGISGLCAMEWNGALRWYATDTESAHIRTAAERAGGHACLFRNGDAEHPFHPLSQAVLAIHQKLKQAFDPARILNPGKMYAWL